jgi:hypothetical protein
MICLLPPLIPPGHIIGGIDTMANINLVIPDCILLLEELVQTTP